MSELWRARRNREVMRDRDVRTPSASGASPLFDDALFARIRNLVVQSRQLTAAGLAGEHRSRRRGLSPEFSDFKPYSPGDDFRRIDWKTYARFDELFVRESETTTEFDIHILIDLSPSMNWSAADTSPSKLRYALQLAGALSILSLWHFDRITIGPLHGNGSRPFGPVQGRSHIMPVYRYLERLTPTSGASASESIARYVHYRSRPGVLIVISDYLDDDAHSLEPTIRRVSSRGWETTLVRIEDPAEAEPERMVEAGVNLELADSESGMRMDIHGGSRTLESYRELRQTWSDELDALGNGMRTRVITARTDEPIEHVVFLRLRALGLVS